VIRLLCTVFFLSRVLSAAIDACAMIPPAQISGMLGTTKNNGITNLKQLPAAANAMEGKACSYIGKDNSATVVWYKFPTPGSARDYMKAMHDQFEKQNVKTTPEKFEGEEGFSFTSGVIAVKKNVWLRVNVYSTAGKVVALDLTRQLMLDALRAN
jgi:hypothetical protein